MGVVALDLRKAFDTVDHAILLDKLHYYGFKDSTLGWFKSYLTNRQQASCVNGNLSEAKTITTGVPQGSILGPLLFLIYMNDIGASFKHSKLNLYADDTLFYYSNPSINTISHVLKEDLSLVAAWLKTNKLSLHLEKTNSMLISSKPKGDNDLNLTLNDAPVTQVDSCKYLGVQIDSRLKFSDHFDMVLTRVRRAIGVFSRAARFIPPHARVTLFNTLILPHIDYCSTVWSTSIRKQDLIKLQRIQNRAMRIILECAPRTHITDMLDTIKWMSIKQRFFYNHCNLLWKINNNMTPDYLSTFFTPISSIHSHNTRSASAGRFYISQSHPKSLNATGSKIWNTLPQHVRDTSSLYSFKKSVLNYIFSHVERF